MLHTDRGSGDQEPISRDWLHGRPRAVFSGDRNHVPNCKSISQFALASDAGRQILSWNPFRRTSRRYAGCVTVNFHYVGVARRVSAHCASLQRGLALSSSLAPLIILTCFKGKQSREKARKRGTLLNVHARRVNVAVKTVIGGLVTSRCK